MEKDNKYFYCVVTDSKSKTTDKMKYVLTTFNVTKFPKEDLKTEVKELGKDKKIITVEFLVNDTESVKTYINSLKENNKFTEISKSDYKDFIISNKNLQKLYKLPILEKYLKFYKANL